MAREKNTGGKEKEAFYFTHDYNARNDVKMQEMMMDMGCEGIGIYWCIVEMLYENGGKLPLAYTKNIAWSLHLDTNESDVVMQNSCNVNANAMQDDANACANVMQKKSCGNKVEKIIFNYDLFKNDGEFFWSESVLIRLEKRKSIVEKRKNAAAKRWKSNDKEVEQKQCKSNANAVQSECTSNAIKGKERKGKEIKYNNIKERENTKRFSPPSIEEVKKFIDENGYSTDAAEFVNFYEAKDWFIGKNKMKNWRAAVATWEKRGKENGRSQKTSGAKNNINVNELWIDV